MPLGHVLDLFLVWMVKTVLNLNLTLAFPPWKRAVTLVGTILLALLTTLVPIRRATRLRPGAALRIADGRSQPRIDACQRIAVGQAIRLLVHRQSLRRHASRPYRRRTRDRDCDQDSPERPGLVRRVETAPCRRLRPAWGYATGRDGLRRRSACS